MDVQGWLQGIADRAPPPNPSDGLDARPSHFALPGVEATTRTDRRRKRRRRASDSSIIAPQPRLREPGGCSQNTGEHRHVGRSVPRSDSAGRQDARSRGSANSNIESRRRRDSRKTYEKRARHKTKADRYELKGRKTKNVPRDETGDDHGSNLRRHRKRRGDDGKRTENLVQGFRLKNGPKNNRLTLKPDVGTGLFKHGRASAQLAGRGNGLPDLAFNELRFLQNHKGHQDEPHQGANGRPSKKERKADAERDKISAYFSKRPAQETSRQPRRSSRAVGIPRPVRSNSPNRRSHARNVGSSPLLSDKELPAVPYLGFGGKGNINQGGQPRSPTTSYLTWSESVVGNLPPVNGERMSEDVLRANQPTAPQRRDEPSKRRTPLIRSTVELPQTNRSGEGLQKRPKRARGTAHFEIYNDQDHCDIEPADETCRSSDEAPPSLPNVPPKAVAQLEHTGSRNQQVPTSSFNTSDILDIRKRLDELAADAPLNTKTSNPPNDNKENMSPPPPPSSPTTKALRVAQEAMAQNHRDALRKPPMVARRVLGHLEGGVFERTSHHTPWPMQRQPLIPQVQASNSHESPWSRQREIPLQSDYAIDQQLWQSDFGVPNGVDEVAVDEMEAYPLSGMVHGANADNTADFAFAIPRAFSRHQSITRPVPYRSDNPEALARDSSWPQGAMSNARGESSRFESAREHGRLNAVMGQDDGFEDELAGFWRPNRLY